MEQLQRYQAPVICAKTAKIVRDYREFATDASSSGAMTGASKRRLPEDVENASMTEGINANDNLPAVPDDGWEQVYAPVELVHTGVVGVPYQGDPVVGPLVVIDTSWWPALDYSVIDPAYKLPPSVTTTEQWRNTICVLPKWAKREMPYEYCVRLAMAGDKEMIPYRKWLKATYAKVHLEKGPRFAGILMAGFLGRIRFQVDTSSPAVKGFQ